MHFIDSPKLVKDAIMTDINNLVEEFWKISSCGVVDVFFIAMHCLLQILQVCSDTISFFNYCQFC
jgi:hypothetical protein